MHARWQLAAESGNEEPRAHAGWLSAAVRFGGDASARSDGGELQQHMLTHVSGVGPSLFKVLLHRHCACSVCTCFRRKAPTSHQSPTIEP